MPSSRRKLNILIADDSATVRRFVIKALHNVPVPIKVSEAADGESCSGKLLTGDFDIAFVDVNMPGQSGFEALADARKLRIDTFVVIISAESSPSWLDEAISLKAYEFLSKPFEEKAVVGIIDNFIRFSDPTSVLVVDDSSSIRKIVKRVLDESLFNLQIDEVQDGPSAIFAYQSGRHDVVFIDLNMPGINGFDTIEMLRKLNEKVRVILFTADESVQLEGIDPKYGVEFLLHKPFFHDDVDLALHGLFNLKIPILLANKKGEPQQDNEEVFI